MLVVGSVLAGIGILLVALVALWFRHPQAPGLARSELAVMLLSVPISGLIGFGLGHVATGVFRLLHGQGNPFELLALLAVAVALAVVIPPVRRRLKAYAAAGRTPVLVAVLPEITLGTDQLPPRSPAPNRPRPTRKAA